MDQVLKEKWLLALRSGKYAKATGSLCKIDQTGNTSYCCLGVLCEIENLDSTVYGNRSTEKDKYLYAYKSYRFGTDGDCPLQSSITLLGSLKNQINGNPNNLGYREHVLNLSNLNDRSSSFDSVITYIETNL